MAFNLYYGNRIENLITENLWDSVLVHQKLSIFTPRRIVIQNQGMAACIKQTLAEYVGICANFEFPFLAKFLSDILKDNLKSEERASAIFHSKEKMIAKIYVLISTEFLHFSEIQAYLGSDNTPQKKLQLSIELASLFDQYQIFRLEEVLRWEKGEIEEENWQAKIYQRVASMGVSRAREIATFLSLESVKSSGDIILFGVSTMAPIFLKMLKKLSLSNTVHFFLMSPTQSKKEVGTVENPLLIAYGKQHLEFMKLCVKAADNCVECKSEESGSDTLSLLKNAVLSNHKEMGKSDRQNIIISKCHSISREIETLYDEILSAIEKEDIAPKDILVMTPSISDYAPFIKAIFDRRNFELSQSERVLNYTITDIPLEEGGTVLSVVDRILNYIETEFTVTGLLDLLGINVIANQFEFSSSDMQYLKIWIEKTGIRWGIDATHREAISGYSFSENSFNSGIDTLLLNMMMKLNESDVIFEGFAVPGVDFGVKESLEKFLLIFRALEHASQERLKVKRPQEFVALLTAILKSFIPQGNETFTEVSLMNKTLKKMAETDFEGHELEFKSLRELYHVLLGKESISTGFLRGKITFCSMQPMRGIPAKFIALLGMNEGSFPRKESVRNFSLLKEREEGDRSKLLEERYIFLETLFSVRSKLLISYIGSDGRKQEERFPSVVVEELQEFVGESNFTMKEHALHGHSTHYFEEGNFLFTYSKQSYESMVEHVKSLKNPVEKSSLEREHSTPMEDERVEISLKELASFFINPSKAFARKKGVSLESKKEVVKNFETLALEGLEKYQINQEIFNALLAGEELSVAQKRMSLKGKAPVQFLGGVSLSSVVGKMQELVSEPLETFDRSLLEALRVSEKRMVEFKTATYTLSGELEPIVDDTMIFARIQSDSEKLKLTAWIHYLVAVATDNAMLCEYFVKKEPIGTLHKTSQLKACEKSEAIEYLNGLVALYKQGMQTPLEYFVKSSAELMRNGEEKARLSFSESSPYSDAENEDEYISLFFNEDIFENPHTLEVAKTVIKYQEEKKEKKGGTK